uniref:Uncharacterized protein n=1 Tax=Anguilla anguilla TaxID=7936 RepID=A0A0E9TMA6_ANGAN
MYLKCPMEKHIICGLGAFVMM